MMFHRRSNSLDKNLPSINLGSPFHSNNIRRNSMSYNELTDQDYDNMEMIPLNIPENSNHNENENNNSIRNRVNDYVINLMNNMNDIASLRQDNINSKITDYKITLLGYFYYCLLCIGMPSLLNTITLGEARLNADILFNFYASPFIYKVCFRNLFLYNFKNNKRNLVFYFFFYIFGFCIRFLDKIESLQSFILNTEFFQYNDTAHLVIFWFLAVYLLFTFVYEIRDTICWKINIGLLIIGLIFVFVSLNEFVKEGIVYHFHHFFIGLLFHIVCQRKRKIISIANNAIGFGIYIEGISLWGFGRIIFK